MSVFKYFIDTCPSFVLQVYQEPLTAALNSNRAILSYADIHIILSPVTHILELNRYTHKHKYSYDTVLFACLCVDMIHVYVFVCAGCFR